jgi:protein involved in polysaccharide export with SLBB domain
MRFLLGVEDKKMTKSMFLISSLVVMSFLGIVQAYGQVSYKGLAIEQRRAEIKREAQEKNAKPVSKDPFEREKELIHQQLSVITGDEDTRNIIVSGDTLQIAYKDQGRIVTTNFQVNGDGEISLPLIGNAKVAGMNRGQAREQLNKLMSEYIRAPELTVEINISGKYTILGAAGPGVYTLEPGMQMLEAILKAGYDTNRANMSNILVMRGGRGKPEILKLNLKKMMLKGDRGDNIAVKPNDLIYIPNTFFHDFDNFKNKIFEYIADYYTLGGATILKPDQQEKPITTITTE